jgi:hypothetical protein
VNENDFQHLPHDLQDIAHALAAHRDTADGHLLERVLARVKASPRPKRAFRGFFRARLAALSMLVLCLGLNVSGALAAVLSSMGLSTASANSLNVSTLFSSLTKTVSTGNNSQSAADEVYCPEGGKGGSDDNSQSGGSEQNMSPEVSTVKSAPVYTKNSKGVVVTTTYTQTTTTTTHDNSEQNGGSESNGGGQCTPCPPSTGSGSEQNGGSENVQTKADTYVNGKMTTTNTTNTTKDGDSSGSEQNGGGGGCPTPEKPGCGNEQAQGVSGGSGVHDGQPPKLDERGSCPQDPGVDGDTAGSGDGGE